MASFFLKLQFENFRQIWVSNSIDFINLSEKTFIVSERATFFLQNETSTTLVPLIMNAQ